MSAAIGTTMSYEEALSELSLALARRRSGRRRRGDRPPPARRHDDDDLADRRVARAPRGGGRARRAGGSRGRRHGRALRDGVPRQHVRARRHRERAPRLRALGRQLRFCRTRTRRASRSRARACTPASSTRPRALLRDEIAAADERGLEIVEVLARNHLAEVETRVGRLGGRARRCPALRRARASGGERADRARPPRFRWDTCRRSSATTRPHGRSPSTGSRAPRRCDDVWYETSHRGVLGLVALAEDDADGAIAVLEPAWARMQEAGIGNPSIFPVTHVLGEAYAAAGRLDDALAVAAALRGGAGSRSIRGAGRWRAAARRSSPRPAATTKRRARHSTRRSRRTRSSPSRSSAPDDARPGTGRAPRAQLGGGARRR